MTTAGRSSTTAAVAGVLILVVIVVLALLVIIGVSRCSRRRGRGWAHGKTRESRLIATVRMLVRCVHWYSKLLLLLLSALRELECIHLLWGDTAHRGTGLKRGHLAQLLGLQQPHVNVLLVCRSNLLLLLLEQLDLLLDSQLFHCKQVQVSWDDGTMGL